MRIPYWIKGGYGGYRNRVERLRDYMSATGNRDRMGFHPDGVIGKWYDDKCLPVMEAYIEAHDGWVNDARRTSVDIIRLAEAWKELVPPYLVMVDVLKSLPGEIVSDEDLYAMAIPQRERKRDSPTRIAKDVPGYTIDRSQAHTIRFTYYDLATGKRRKADGQREVEVCYLILDEIRIVRGSELVSKLSSTSNPLVLPLSERDSGRHICFALRWVSARGEPGPLSEIVYMVIP
ncbi:MAG: hypothetical protein LBG30_07860 [Odoribacteraceae bacterium]|nr:hypothetical protein [Odoribacteraceae bacterium]